MPTIIFLVCYQYKFLIFYSFIFVCQKEKKDQIWEISDKYIPAPQIISRTNILKKMKILYFCLVLIFIIFLFYKFTAFWGINTLSCAKNYNLWRLLFFLLKCFFFITEKNKLFPHMISVSHPTVVNHTIFKCFITFIYSK